jgi:predicted GTPase
VTRGLITGMSGVGKSSLLAELARRRYRTVDTDFGDYHETVDGEPLEVVTTVPVAQVADIVVAHCL